MSLSRRRNGAAAVALQALARGWIARKQARRRVHEAVAEGRELYCGLWIPREALEQVCASLASAEPADGVPAQPRRCGCRQHQQDDKPSVCTALGEQWPPGATDSAGIDGERLGWEDSSSVPEKRRSKEWHTLAGAWGHGPFRAQDNERCACTNADTIDASCVMGGTDDDREDNHDALGFNRTIDFSDIYPIGDSWASCQDSPCTHNFSGGYLSGSTEGRSSEGAAQWDSDASQVGQQANSGDHKCVGRASVDIDGLIDDLSAARAARLAQPKLAPVASARELVRSRQARLAAFRCEGAWASSPESRAAASRTGAAALLVSRQFRAAAKRRSRGQAIRAAESTPDTQDVSTACACTCDGIDGRPRSEAVWVNELASTHTPGLAGATDSPASLPSSRASTSPLICRNISAAAFAQPLTRVASFPKPLHADIGNASTARVCATACAAEATNLDKVGDAGRRADADGCQALRVSDASAVHGVGDGRHLVSAPHVCQRMGKPGSHDSPLSLSQFATSSDTKCFTTHAAGAVVSLAGELGLASGHDESARRDVAERETERLAKLIMEEIKASTSAFDELRLAPRVAEADLVALRSQMQHLAEAGSSEVEKASGYEAPRSAPLDLATMASAAPPEGPVAEEFAVAPTSEMSTVAAETMEEHRARAAPMPTVPATRFQGAPTSSKKPEVYPYPAASDGPNKVRSYPTFSRSGLPCKRPPHVQSSTSLSSGELGVWHHCPSSADHSLTFWKEEHTLGAADRWSDLPTRLALRPGVSLALAFRKWARRVEHSSRLQLRSTRAIMTRRGKHRREGESLAPRTGSEAFPQSSMMLHLPLRRAVRQWGQEAACRGRLAAALDLTHRRSASACLQRWLCAARKIVLFVSCERRGQRHTMVRALLRWFERFENQHYIGKATQSRVRSLRMSQAFCRWRRGAHAAVRRAAGKKPFSTGGLYPLPRQWDGGDIGSFRPKRLVSSSHLPFKRAVCRWRDETLFRERAETALCHMRRRRASCSWHRWLREARARVLLATCELDLRRLRAARALCCLLRWLKEQRRFNTHALACVRPLRLCHALRRWRRSAHTALQRATQRAVHLRLLVLHYLRRWRRAAQHRRQSVLHRDGGRLRVLRDAMHRWRRRAAERLHDDNYALLWQRRATHDTLRRWRAETRRLVCWEEAREREWRLGRARRLREVVHHWRTYWPARRLKIVYDQRRLLAIEAAFHGEKHRRSLWRGWLALLVTQLECRQASSKHPGPDRLSVSSSVVTPTRLISSNAIGPSRAPVQDKSLQLGAQLSTPRTPQDGAGDTDEVERMVAELALVRSELEQLSTRLDARARVTGRAALWLPDVGANNSQTPSTGVSRRIFSTHNSSTASAPARISPVGSAPLALRGIISIESTREPSAARLLATPGSAGRFLWGP